MASLIGALVHTQVTLPVVACLFAILLVIAGLLGLTELSVRIELGRKAAWIGGAASGFFSALAGAQGFTRVVSGIILLIWSAFVLKKTGLTRTTVVNRRADR